MTPRIVPEASITPAEDAAIRESLCECFPPDVEIFSKTRSWHGTFPTWSILVEDQDRVVAHAGVVEREILIGDKRVKAAGIQNVLVLPAYRKTDLFRQVMELSMEEAARRGVELGLLFCTKDLGRVYAWVGWKLVKGRTVLRADENGVFQPLPEKNITMFHPLSRTEFPQGDIHLLGNDW